MRSCVLTPKLFRNGSSADAADGVDVDEDVGCCELLSVDADAGACSQQEQGSKHAVKQAPAYALLLKLNRLYNWCSCFSYIHLPHCLVATPAATCNM